MTKKKSVNKPAAPAKVEASTSVSEGKLPSNEAAAPNDELQSSEILQDAVALVAEHNKETDENKLRYVHQDQLAHKNFTLHETVELAPQARAQKALQIANFSMERGFIGLSDCALVAAAPNITTFSQLITQALVEPFMCPSFLSISLMLRAICVGKRNLPITPTTNLTTKKAESLPCPLRFGKR